MGYQGNYPPSTPLNPTQLGTGVVTTDAIANGAVIPADLSTGGPYWDTSGNVGIGTASPGAKLDVNGVLVSRSNIQSLASVGYVQAVSTTNAAVMQLISDGGAGYVQADGTSAIPMLFRIQGAEKMRLDTSGNLGIGTSSPANNAGYQTLTINGTSGGVAQIQVAGTNTFQIFSSATANYLNGQTALPMAFFTNAVERMRIDSSGNVGIGTTTLAGKVTIQGTSTTNPTTLWSYGYIANGTVDTRTGTIRNAFDTNSSYSTYWTSFRGANGSSYRSILGVAAGAGDVDVMTLDSLGNVGIGTSPSYRFHVATGNDGYVTYSSGALDYRTLVYNSGSVVYTGTWSNHPLVFNTNGTERVRITNGGQADFYGLIRASYNLTYSTLRNSSGGLGALEVVSANNSSAAFMSFHKPGAYASYFGLDNDNWFAVGGWSAGAGLANFKAAAISKSSGSFTIDHPIPEMSETHNLVHSFIEGPQADLIYRGRITLESGKAIVNVDTASGMTDGTFVLLCRDVQCYTSNETGWTPVRGSIVGNILTIEAEDSTCTDTISWLVIGERQDKHMYDTPWTDEIGKVIVEPLKNSAAAKSEVEV